MIILRQFENKLFLLLFISIIICIFETSIASGNQPFIDPAEIKPDAAIALETAPFPLMAKTEKLHRNTIGCVLPLSGKHAALGQKALDAIMLSAGIMNRKNNDVWGIIVEDSQGLPDKTKQAVANLANIKNVMAIIAVDTKENALETATEANKWKIPIILITSKEGVTSAGEFVFQHFLTHSQEIKTLVEYALNHLNCAIFSVLYPQDEYGEEMLKIFSKEVKLIGGKVDKAISYSINQVDFAGEISKLTGIVVRYPSLTSQNDKRDVVPVEFEALFIPDSSLRVKMLTSQLDFYNVKGFVFLGTSLWNDPHLLKNVSENLDKAFFVDIFPKDSSYPENHKFVDAYVAAYKREPENIDALAFDTAGMIFSILSSENIKTRRDLATGLKEIVNYNGATGSIYFDSDRISLKTPFVFRIKNGKFQPIR
ncbi:MAG: penicillin-binding protein activator [Syntrophaceae bacterium]|nr:penicillin-binding protein activator [Syntrophaceae bacterium]